MNNQYSCSEIFKNIYSLVLTKLTMPKARFVRRPIYLRGKKLVKGCKGLTTGRFCRFDLAGVEPTLFIGDDCSMGDMTHIVAHEKVTIGENVLIASKCFISDTSHGDYSGEKQEAPDIPPGNRSLITKPVRIGDNVWIGENVVILGGANIGNGSVIGANSVVKGYIPSGCICVGMPAKVIKKWDEQKRVWVKVEE